MQQEDKELIDTLKKNHHRIIDSITEKYNGKVIEYYGGSTLCIFPSAIDAVQCGIDLQTDFLKDPAIPVKIGIHTGDVIFNNEGVIGDGVNVASRVESLAVKGSIFVSGKVYDEIKNQKSIQAEYLGKFHLKNVVKPIDLYVVSNDPLIVPTPDQLVQPSGKTIVEDPSRPSLIHGNRKKLMGYGFLLFIILVTGIIYLLNRDRTGFSKEVDRTIAVLPFENLNQNKEQEYFSDGITEDIITQLSKVDELKVISRSSIMRYKKTTKTIEEIAKELDVVHVLEGSVRKYGDSVRISMQLTDTKTNNMIWANIFDRELVDIFEVQRNVAYEVAIALHATLTRVEKENINKKPTEIAEAFELYLQGLYNLRMGTKEGLNKSFPLLRESILLDPDFADAYAEIAGYYVRQGAWRGTLSPDVARDEAIQYTQKSLELNPDLKLAHTRLGTIKFWFYWDFVGAETEYRKGGISDVYGFFLLMMGRFKEAEAMFNEISVLDPFDSHDRPHRGVTQYYLGNPDDAIRILRSGVGFHPNVLTGYHKLGKIYLVQEKYTEAIETLELGIFISKERLPAILGDLAIAYDRTGNYTKSTELINELKILQLKGPQGSPSFFLAQIYAGIGENELAFEWLEKAYLDKEVEMIWLKIEPQFNSIRNDPRFTDLLEKVGFTI